MTQDAGEASGVRMVDVGDKPSTHRVAVARGRVRMSASTVQAIRQGRVPKGDPLAVAQVAGIQGAKLTPFLIPLCHPIPLTGVQVELSLQEDGVAIEARVRAYGPTGVEMEALAAVTCAALSLYDTLKGLERGMVIEEVRLVRKEGGQGGTWAAADRSPKESG